MKHLKYLRYILRHKWFVFIGCCKAGIPWQGLMHDISKLSPREWFPYVDHFYGTEREKKLAEPAFDKAWLHHQNRNKHHWQYWMLHRDTGEVQVLSMPEKYAKEMLCDWIAVSKALGRHEPDATLKWYETNKNKIKLHGVTRAFVEIMLRGY